MYLRVTERRNRDGTTVAYYALAENDWNAEAKRSETRVIHSFGRADQLDRAALQRLVASINRVIDADAADTLPTRGKTAVGEIDIDAVFELGVVLAARGLWEQLGIGEAIRSRMACIGLTAPHEMALFAMAAQRLDDPGSKLACATRWLPDIAWLPEADNLAVDQLYRALDFLAVWSDEIEEAYPVDSGNAACSVNHSGDHGIAETNSRWRGGARFPSFKMRFPTRRTVWRSCSSAVGPAVSSAPPAARLEVAC